MATHLLRKDNLAVRPEPQGKGKPHPSKLEQPRTLFRALVLHANMAFQCRVVDNNETFKVNIVKLIETSNFDAFSPLLIEVERELLDYMKELQNDDDEEVHQIEHERAMLFSKYEVGNSEFKIKAIYEKFIKQVEEKYLN